jgi:hypothetical protein
MFGRCADRHARRPGTEPLLWCRFTTACRFFSTHVCDADQIGLVPAWLIVDRLPAYEPKVFGTFLDPRGGNRISLIRRLSATSCQFIDND